MSYTATYLNAVTPSNSAMPAIGSVEENFRNSTSADSNNNELMDLLFTTKEAESIRATYGETEFQEFIDAAIKKKDDEVEKVLKLEEKKAKRGIIAPKGSFKRQIKKIAYKILDAYTEGV